jgi:hypothetical protein
MTSLRKQQIEGWRFTRRTAAKMSHMRSVCVPCPMCCLIVVMLRVAHIRVEHAYCRVNDTLGVRPFRDLDQIRNIKEVCRCTSDILLIDSS